MPWEPSNNPKVRKKWRVLVDELDASDQPVRVFASRRGIGPHTLSRWRAHFRREAVGPEQGPVEAEPQLPSVVEVLVDAGQQGGGLVVDLRCGDRVHLTPGFDEVALTRLLRVLERR